MNHSLTVFNNDHFGQLRTVSINGNPWFVAADVCKALEICDTGKAVARLDPDEGTRIEIAHPQNPDKTLEVLAVSESGLYSLVLGSRKPEARQFKRWVTHDIIPSIRSHGAYLTPELTAKVLSDPDTLIALATNLKSEQAARRAAEAQIAADAPKVLFANSVSQSSDEIPIGEMANFLRQNGLDIGRNRLFDRLRQDGYIQKTSRLPTQRAMDLGLFRVVESITTNPDGSSRLNYTTKVTGKGQIYFVSRYITRSDTLGFLPELFGTT